MKPLTHMFGWLGLVGWRYKRGYDVTAGSSKRWVVSRVVVVVRSTRSPAMAAVWCRYEFLLGNTPQDVSIQLQQCTKGDPHAYFCQDAAQCPHGVYNPSATNFQVEVDTDYGSGSVLLPSASGRCEPRFAPVGVPACVLTTLCQRTMPQAPGMLLSTWKMATTRPRPSNS